MKSMIILSIVAALVGGCAIVPLGHGGRHDGYYRDRGYNRGGGNYRNRDGGTYREHGYRRDRGSQEDPFWERGG